MSEPAPVYLNVYDLTPYNGYLYWIGLGIYHSGVEVHGVEYAYGAHDYPTSGVFEVEPRNTPGFEYRTTILMGTTMLSSSEMRAYVEEISEDYNGDTYHLITKNCNHFTNDLTTRLVGKQIPNYINRLARIGWLVNCILPEGLRVDAVKATPEYHTFSGDSDDEIGLHPQQDSIHLLSAQNGGNQSQVRDRMREFSAQRFHSSSADRFS